MDPISLGTIAAISMGSAAAGGVLGAAGSIFQGKAQSNAYKYQAGIAGINANIARQNADYENKVGEVEAQKLGLKGRYNIGATKVAQGAGGFDVNKGSNRAVQESESDIAQQDQAITRGNAARRAYGYNVKALESSAQGELYRTAASTSRTSGAIGAASSILGAASSVSSKWMQAKSIGLFGDT